MKVVIHIVPSYPPKKGGVADFCELVVNNTPQIKHLVISYQQNQLIDPLNQIAFKQENKFNLPYYITEAKKHLKKNDQVYLMLHYVSYGYQKYGIPMFILKGIQPFLKEMKLVTFFHEIYSLGKKKPWQSSFWAKPIQQYIIKKLLEKSIVIYTNNKLYREKLHLLNNK
jgi:hypothetical protein